MADDMPQHRYDAETADELETRWQAQWLADGTHHAPNPAGHLADDPLGVADRPKLFIMDMFPYPSGSGLHVGHPLGYIATDVYARFKRMSGFNVLHTMGFDAFGLPAEEHARQTGSIREATPRTTSQHDPPARRLGLGHDKRRSIATTDEAYYRWTQWIFNQIFNAWFDPDAGKARPIAELKRSSPPASAPLPTVVPGVRSPSEQRSVLHDFRLAYVSEAPVNWCPGLGTVLANEEVTADGRSDRGNFPVFKRPLKQWMMRITAYADRLLEDLDLLDWSDSIKTMQRNWIGRSEGAEVRCGRCCRGDAASATTIDVFTTRPDTLFGATYMVLAPEHPLVDTLVADAYADNVNPAWTAGAATPAAAVAAYRARRADDRRRPSGEQGEDGRLSGCPRDEPGQRRVDPGVHRRLCPDGLRHRRHHGRACQDERDWDFAMEFGLPIIRTVQPPADFDDAVPGDGAYVGDGPAVNSSFLDDWASRTPRPRSSSGSKPTVPASGWSPRSCATGCSPVSATRS